MQKTHVYALLFTVFSLQLSLNGQIVGDAVFLQGDHLEIGIAACGAYGTSNAPPAVGAAGTAYHPTETGLGFVADASVDGWGVGTPPYCGDYFLPGSPVEGFTMTIAGQRYNNSSGFGICGVTDIPGAIVAYTDGDTLSATWEGVHPDGFRLSIRTYFPREKRYFIGEVTLENLGTATLEDIYFSRQVDPDNDQAWGGGFPTNNKIVSQPGPGSSDALATADGTLGCFLGLGARHFASRASRGGFFVQDALDPYCGNSPYELDGEATTDDAIGVNFYFARLEGGNSLTFSYAYILDTEELEEALMATTAPVLVADGLPVQAEDGVSMPEIRVCVGDSVFLEVQGGDNYFWDWTHYGDFRPVSAIAGWLKPTVAGTYSVMSTVPCGENIEFSFEVLLGESATLLAAIPDVSICPGTTVALSGGVDLSGLTLTWAPAALVSDPNSPGATVTLETPETAYFWTIDAVDAQGCASRDTVHIRVHPAPVISAGPDKAGVVGTSVSLSGSGAAVYQWSPESFLSGAGSAQPQAVVIDTMVFTLVGTDANGCVDTDEMTLFALPDQRFVVPNAFTPDGDGLHDCFHTGQPIGMEFSELRIFNRWGEVVFVGFDSDACWDGTFRGKPQPMGSYIVVLQYSDVDGNPVKRTSSLTLIR